MDGRIEHKCGKNRLEGNLVSFVIFRISKPIWVVIEVGEETSAIRYCCRRLFDLRRGATQVREKEKIWDGEKNERRR